MRSGDDVRYALCGAGIDASHAYEQTRIDSINATYELVKTYLTQTMI